MDNPHEDGKGLSRRAFAGVGATVAAVGVARVPIRAAPPTVTPRLTGTQQPEVVGPASSTLTYITLDAMAFAGEATGARVYSTATGVAPTVANTRIWAPLPIPAGSTIHEFSVSYTGSPIVEISLRSAPGSSPIPSFQQTVPNSPGTPGSTTFVLSAPITTQPYVPPTVSAFCVAGAAIFGVTVGYVSPTQSFVPFTGTTPRVLDTRQVGGKLAPGEERTVALGNPGARGAVLNLTITDTEGAGGFVGVFPANVSWPGNSSINWFGPDQNLASGVITAVDTQAQIKIRCGAARTNVVIDRVGWML